MRKIKQVIYVDVLFCLNMIISFFLISMSKKLCGVQVKTFRVLFGSAMGGVYSLSIFLPELNSFLSFSLRVVFLGLVTLIVFGFGYIKRFARCFAVLSAVSFLFAGLLMGIWLLFKPDGLLIKNGSFYVDVSFLTLVLSAAALYAAVWLFSRIALKRSSEAANCRAEITFGEKLVSVNGVVDTGNTLTDSFTGKKVSVIDFSTALRLLPSSAASCILSGELEKLPKYMHLTVLNTVSGESLLPVFTADLLKVKTHDTAFEFENAAVAVSLQENFSKNASILINADLITENIGGEEYDKKNNSKDKRMVKGKKKQRSTLHKRSADSACSLELTARDGNNAENRARR